ncbi:MAG: IPT/TIG domain-containing protein [Phycisphaerales bacterium]|nr:IPT/TIG domain-containing protein [Phycisphaerales bacterium]
MRMRKLMLNSGSFFFGAVLCAGAALNLAGCPAEGQIAGEASTEGDAKVSELVRQFRISPAAGPVEGGTVVTIVGNGFIEGTSVEFGVNASPEIHVLNDQVMTALVPPGDPGVVDLILRFPNGGMTNGTPIPVRVPGGFQYYVLPPDDGTDTDADGLTDYQELTGWEIWNDAFGLGLGADTFGNVARYTCISDPNVADTDGDGLNDKEEFLAKSDARNADTDGDGLHDYEEVVRWKTSPTSIDSDGDSRSTEDTKVAPNSKLFDGAELHTVGFEPAPTELFISEYVEAEGSNRAIELYNPGELAIDLSAGGYALRVFPATGRDAPYEITLRGQIAPHETFVIAHPDAPAATRAAADQIERLPFSGIECVYVMRGTTLVDSLGSNTFSRTDANQPYTQLLQSNFVEAWQDFTSQRGGILSGARIQLRNYSSQPFIATVRIVRGATEIGAASFEVPGLAWDFYRANFEAPVSVGEQLRMIISANSSSAAINMVPVDAYPGGASSFGPTADLYFVTYIAPSGAQSDGAASMRDATLRRRAVAGAPDQTLEDAPALGAFEPLSAGTIDGLGAHQNTIVPVRIIDGGTSPSLADTDGDGVSDYHEIDTPVRTAVVADLPEIRFELVDPVAVNLRVEYADSIGSEVTYGTEMSRSETNTNSRTDIESTTKSWSVGAELGFEGKMPTGKVSGSYGQEQTEGTEITSEKAIEAASAYSQEQSASRERTVTSSRGTVAVGLRAVNSGKLAYTLNGLSIAVRQFVPHDGTYRALTTLLPPTSDASYTLAPGDSTTVLALKDDDVNPGVIRAFLANPSSVLLEPATFELLNAEGTNFLFTTEQAFARTALVVVDFGNGTLIKHRIATNVDRTPAGGFAGVRMADVMRDLNLYFAADNLPGEPRRLTSVNGIGEQLHGGAAPALGDPPYPVGHEPGDRPLRAFWYVVRAGAETELTDEQLHVDFEDIVLHARDEIRLVFVRDEDRDGLNDRQEYTLGSSDSAIDSDGDQLSDWFEGQVGWTVNVTGQSVPPPHQVFGSPLLADADEDGWNDLQEYTQGTDPHNADTDDDSMLDSLDPRPLHRAVTLFVRASAPAGDDGMSWASAMPSLLTAVNAALGANYDSDPGNDVRQIWVAEGNYAAPDIITIYGEIAIYGGFAGNETKRSDRNSDPTTNNTRIIWSPGTARVIHMLNGANRLDGFSIEGAQSVQSGAAMYVASAAGTYLANLLFIDNHSTAPGGAVFQQGYSSYGVTYENVIFSGNSAKEQGGAVRLNATKATFIGCQFQNNTVDVSPTSQLGGGGALAADFCTELEFLDCLFRANSTTMAVAANANYYRMGGAMLIRSTAEVRMKNCSMRSNEIVPVQGDVFDAPQRSGGGLAWVGAGALNAIGCTFSTNRCPKTGGGAYVLGTEISGPATDTKARFTNCTFAANQTYTVTSNYAEGGAFSSSAYPSGAISFNNTIFWANTSNGAGVPGTEREQLGRIGLGYAANNCCIQNLDVGYSNRASGTANIGADPFFLNLSGGDFRIQAGSACIDAGNRTIDTDLTQPGTQPLPEFDIRGGIRILDGDGDGYAEVDIGATEFQGD